MKNEQLTQELQLDIAKAQFLSGTEETRQALIRIFGKAAFPESKRVEDMNINDIMQAAGISDQVRALINYTGDDEDLIGVRGFLAISAIRKVFNQNKIIDYTNGKSKYYVYVDMTTATGAGFSYSDFDTWNADSGCGSHLCFLESEMALLAIKNFQEYFMDLFNIRNQIPAAQLRVLKSA